MASKVTRCPICQRVIPPMPGLQGGDVDRWWCGPCERSFDNKPYNGTFDAAEWGAKRARAVACSTEKRSEKAVWCVRHRDGWCATKTGRPHSPRAPTVETKCGFSVVRAGTAQRSPEWGAAKRIPSCFDCLFQLGQAVPGKKEP